MKFVFIYTNNTPNPDVSREEIMESWGKWFQDLGDKLVDGGNPFNDGAQAVNANSVSAVGKDHYVGGYSIIEAKDMDEAVELAKGCPMHKHSNGTAIVEVYEAMPM